MIVATVVNDSGRAFNVRAVRVGDRYGLGDKLIHSSALGPMIEFYDATYENDPRFTLGRGQFVARYYVSTLATHDPSVGLDLLGHVPEWKINATNVRDALASARHALNH